jgi:hypothetical protein
MATTSWETIRLDTIALIEEMVPTVEPSQRFRHTDSPRKEGAGRDREFYAKRWSPVPGVMVFGGGEDQLGRDLMIEVWYADGPLLEEMRHADEQLLVATLEPRGGYPTGAWGGLMVRRVNREAVESDRETAPGHVKVTFPIRLIWRELVSHL